MVRLQRDGKQDGKWTEWDKNGQITSEKNYKDGKQDGKWTQWHEKGQKKSEVELQRRQSKMAKGLSGLRMVR